MRHVYNKDYEILKFDTNSLPGTYLKKPFLIKINNIKIVNKVFFFFTYNYSRAYK